jgi:predicted Fe-S protein YdhL (DUF1289 family)
MLDVAIWFTEIVLWVRACMQESQERLRWNAAAPKERETVGRKVEERSNATKLRQKKTRKTTTKGQHLMTSSVTVSNLSDVSKERSGIA